MSEKSGSFEEFKNAFADGPNRDLNFKFLKALSEEEAETFFWELFAKLGDTLDDGDAGRLIAHIQAWQARGYGAPVAPWIYDDGPFTRLTKPVSQSRIALLSSAGFFVEGHDPRPLGVENMSQEEAMRRIKDFIAAEPELTAIPVDTPPERLRVRHGGYDVHGSQTDANVTMPIYRLLSLVQERIVGELVDPVYSFVGATAQVPLLRKRGPAWVRRVQEHQADAAILVPA